MTSTNLLKPRDKQIAPIERTKREFTLGTHSAIWNFPTGSGKTFMSLFVSRDLGYNTILVVAPLNTRNEDGWEDSSLLIRPDLPFKQIEKGKEHHFEELVKGVPGVYFVVRQFFSLSGTIGHDDKGNVTRKKKFNWSRAKPDLMIVDESHESTGNRYAGVYKTLMKPQPKNKIALSATPSSSDFHKMWELTRFLWKDRIDGSKNRWIAEWCDTSAFSPFSDSLLKQVKGERVPGEFVKTLPCYLTMEEVGKKPVELRKVSCPMTSVQEEQYHSMKETAIAWLESHPLVEDIPMIQKLRMRQIALGELSWDDEDNIVIADDAVSSKADACEKINKHHPDDCIVFYTDSKRFASFLVNRLGDGAVLWAGGLTRKKRTDIRNRFGKDIKCIVAVISAFGTGTNGMQFKSHVEVWCNKSFTEHHNVQAEGRLNRQGQEADKIIRYLLVAPNSGDVEDFSRLREKRKTVNASL